MAKGLEINDIILAAVALHDNRVIIFTAPLASNMGTVPPDAVTWVYQWDPLHEKTERVGRLNYARTDATVTKLKDGRILVVGGRQASVSEIWDPSTQTASYAPGIEMGRFEHAAVLLADGRVLVSGGKESERPNVSPVASAEVWDPKTRQWTRIADMKTFRVNHGLVPLPDGSAWAIGGGSKEADYSERWDPVRNEWSEMPEPELTRHRPDLHVYRDGSVAVFGWNNLDYRAVEVWSPELRAWSFGPSLYPRSHYATARLSDGRIMVIGGYLHGPKRLTLATRSVQVWRPSDGRWESFPSLQVPRALHSAAVLEDGRVVVLMGRDRNQTMPKAETWNPGAHQWQRDVSSPATSILYGNRMTHDIATLPDGRLFLSYLHLGRVIYEVLHPTAGWGKIPQYLGSGGFGSSSTVLADGQVLVAGGEYPVQTAGGDGATSYTKSTQVVDLRVNVSKQGPSFQWARAHHLAVRLATGSVLVVGGTGKPSAVELLEPHSDQWKPIGAPDLDRLFSLDSAMLKSGCLVVKGSNAWHGPGLVRAFDPNSMQWMQPRDPRLQTISGRFVQGAADEDEIVLLPEWSEDRLPEEPMVTRVALSCSDFEIIPGEAARSPGELVVAGLSKPNAFMAKTGPILAYVSSIYRQFVDVLQVLVFGLLSGLGVIYILRKLRS
ncbi:MAG: kelch repeat-containing protein [Nitrospirota bacterium]